MTPNTTNHEKKMLIWRGGYWEEHQIAGVKILLDRIPDGATHYIQASIGGEPHFYKEGLTMARDKTNKAKVLAWCTSCGYKDFGMDGYPPMNIPDGIARWEEGRSCPECGTYDWEVSR